MWLSNEKIGKTIIMAGFRLFDQINVQTSMNSSNWVLLILCILFFKKLWGEGEQKFPEGQRNDDMNMIMIKFLKYEKVWN